MNNAIGLAGFGVAALGYALLALLLTIHLRSNPALAWLLFAVLVTLAWALGFAVMLQRGVDPGYWLWAADAARNGAWLLFLASLMPKARGFGIRRGLIVAAALACGWLALEAALSRPLLPFVSLPLLLLLGLSLLGLLAIEQLYRNADPRERQSIGMLALALGGVFTFELFVYSHALLLMGLEQPLWLSRAFVAALILPVLVVFVRRSRRLRSELYVSREMVFYAATLLGTGGYLLAMSAVGYVLRAGGGEWGVTLQAAFLAAAALLLVGVLFSARLRARVRVFLSKHFFQSRYDYRNEWLNLIGTLADREGGNAPARALTALRNILGSEAGDLWLHQQAGDTYVRAEGTGLWGEGALPTDHPVTRFLVETNWIVDSDEYFEDPEKYSHAFRGRGAGLLPAASLLVPLRLEGQLLGFARLDRPPGQRALNYEDHDLLKTVGRQLAVFIAQEQAQMQLAETRQFEAFNRMTAFLMHDLKNLMAQQALIVQNAPRLKHRPEFVDDAFRTIERSVERMRRLLDQLQQGVTAAARTRVNLTPILEEAVIEAASRRPVPTLHIREFCEVRGDRDRLAMMVSHALRNAQDATPADGEIKVLLERSGPGEVVIEVTDTGCGMDEAFVRDRLFRPFDTTKGASGMGVGAYQIREYVTALGGRVEVRSRPGEGTALRLVLPAAPDERTAAA